MRLSVLSPSVVGALLAPALLLSACSGEVSVGGPATVERADLEAELSANMSGPDADQFDVACEGDLEAEVEATQDCLITFSEDGSTTGVRLVVTAVEGDEVEFDQTLFIPAGEVADAVERTYADPGLTIDEVTCAGELLGKEGATTTCDIASSEGDVTVEATTTTVDGLVVNFDLTVVS